MLKSMLKPFKAKNYKKPVSVPLEGHADNRYVTPYVDILSTEDLEILNGLLPWHCYTIDQNGRRFGQPAWEGKRNEPEVIPDPRLVLLYKEFDFKDKTVLEIGCFEGIHTLALFEKGAKNVIAIDSRLENVLKTLVRCNMFGLKPSAFKCNIEEHPLPLDLLKADIMHHVGVFYHLADPVQHLLDIGRYISEGIILDTHYALPESVNKEYTANGKTYAYQYYQEYGYQDPFSGMYNHSKWLLLEDICTLLQESGFSQVEIKETIESRNGPRVSIIAKR